MGIRGFGRTPLSEIHDRNDHLHGLRFQLLQQLLVDVPGILQSEDGQHGLGCLFRTELLTDLLRPDETLHFRCRPFRRYSDGVWRVAGRPSIAQQTPSLVKLTTWQIGAELQLRAFGRYFIKGDVNYANQEVRTDVIRQRLTMGLQLKTNF